MTDATDSGRLQPLQGYQLEPYHYYDVDWFRQEQQHLFSQHWAFVGFAHEVANPGDYLVAEVGNNPIIVCRDLHGQLHAMHNICRHRGIRMYADCGNAKALSCPYHAWRYGLDGRLEHVPQHKQQFPNLKLEEWGLIPAQVDVWASMVFVHTDPKAPGLRAWLAGLATRLQRFDGQDLVELSVQHYPMAANWKFFIENHIDWLHLYFLHAKTLNAYNHDAPELAQHGPHWTSFEQPRPGKERHAAQRQAGLIELPGLKPEDGDIGAHLIFPNLALITSPTSFASVFVRPMSAEACRVEVRLQVVPGSDPAQLEAAQLKEVMAEDQVAAEELQIAVRSDAYTIGPMAMTWEAPIARFHEHYRRSMGLAARSL